MGRKELTIWMYESMTRPVARIVHTFVKSSPELHKPLNFFISQIREITFIILFATTLLVRFFLGTSALLRLGSMIVFFNVIDLTGGGFKLKCSTRTRH